MQFPQVSGGFIKSDLHWLCRLPMLIERFSYLGISEDVSSLCLDDARGLYLYLERMEASDGTKS